MKLKTFIDRDLKYNLEAIAADKELTLEIQTRLIDLGLLEPPADGKFGPVSTAALKKFQGQFKLYEPEHLGRSTAKALLEAEKILPPPLLLGDDLASRIIRYMQAKKYQIFQGIKQYNIVYIEGINTDGVLNPDSPNCFNDVRLILEIVENVPSIKARWEATTEPGSHYTYRPMNAGGAARIKFGQYKAWRIGFHGTADRHEALVQTGGEVTVHRDFNKDFRRTGDKLDTGYFGINQHWGYDLPHNNIANAGAGCLVGRTRQGHREFMGLIKQDRRYQLNKDYCFYAAILPGDEL
jgi:hypothetical protein